MDEAWKLETVKIIMKDKVGGGGGEGEETGKTLCKLKSHVNMKRKDVLCCVILHV